LLHYLDRPKCREEPDRYCRLHHLNSYLRGNWVVTKDLVEFAIQKGWVTAAGEKAYRITEKGQRYLPDLRRAFEPMYPDAMARFLEMEK
jgi:GR25 family glycosyltransferase involved in LPS biosynthesis